METLDQETSFCTERSGADPIHLTPSSKEALAQKAADLMTPEFIETRIRPLYLTSSGRGFDCRSEIVQNTGTGRLTLRYDFGPENVFFAKLYIDELGPRY